MEAIYELFRWLKPEEMKVTFLGIPMLNTPAFDLIRRTGPDEIILNRTGGGNRGGFLTEKITRFFMDHIVRRSDYGIEIIDIGMHYKITSFVAPAKRPDGTLDLDYAKSFGVDLVWLGNASSSVVRNAASQAGVNVFMTELGGEGRSLPQHVDTEVRGLKNALRHLTMIQGEPERTISRYFLYDSFWMHSQSGGIFRSTLQLRQKVSRGEVLATIHDLLDREVEIIHSPHDGIVIGLRTVPRIRPGDWTVWVGRIIDEIGP
jgi:predicted deacylase